MLELPPLQPFQLRWLLKANGTDINVPAADGYTALDYSAYDGKEGMIRLLMSRASRLLINR